MARTYSTMMALGTKAPEFSLPDTVDGKTLSLADIRGHSGTLILFICNHCPFVKHIADALAVLNTYLPQGLGIAAISANDVEQYPADAPDKMKAFARDHGLAFPYLYDASQSTALAYNAVCTPEFFLFDKDLKCVYRGRFDAASPGNEIAVTGNDLRAAIDALLNGQAIDAEQHPSLGCNIKWKPETKR